MDDAARKIIGDAAESVVSEVVADPGKADNYPLRADQVRRFQSATGRTVLTIPAFIEAGSKADLVAVRAGMPEETCVSIGDMTESLVRAVLKDVKRNLAKGVRPLRVRRTGLDTIDVEFEGGRTRSGVPQHVKHEMAEMARAGLTAREIGEEYGYPEPDVVRILKSMKIRAPEAAPLPAQKAELGLTGIDAATELDIAEALMSGMSPEDVAAALGVPLAHVKAVKDVWNEASPTEAAAEVVAYRQELVAEKAVRPDVEIDPTTDGEILFYQGSGRDGWRVEIAPHMELKLKKCFDMLRSATIHGSAATEHKAVSLNIRRYADRNLPDSDKRFKSFAWGGVKIKEFKGFQARVFAETMKSSYPDGREVWRCGLVMCMVKKRDDATNADLEKVIDAMEKWRSWRTEQDRKISEGMQ